MLWNIFNTLQIIIALELFMVKFPANVTIVQDQFEKIINFEVVPKEFLYNAIIVPLFGVKTAEEEGEIAHQVSEKRAEKGYEVSSEGLVDRFKGTNIFMNILLVILAITVLATAILLCLGCKYLVLSRCPRCFHTLVDKLLRKLMWNSFLRAILESYLTTAIFVFISARGFDAYTLEGRMEILTTTIIGVFIVGFPFKAWNFMFRNMNELTTPNYRLSYDSLYQNVDTLKGPIALSFTLLFCLRRLAFAYSVSYVQQTIVF